jgi:hypothetical protein
MIERTPILNAITHVIMLLGVVVAVLPIATGIDDGWLVICDSRTTITDAPFDIRLDVPVNVTVSVAVTMQL